MNARARIVAESYLSTVRACSYIRLAQCTITHKYMTRTVRMIPALFPRITKLLCRFSSLPFVYTREPDVP